MANQIQADASNLNAMGQRFIAAWNRASLVKARLSKDRPMASITLRIPVDVVESMKNIAVRRGFVGYQTLVKAYLSEGLRRDEVARDGEGAAAEK